MARIITTEIIREEMNKINPDIEIIGEYTKAKEPILCKCNICGHKWEPTPSNLKKGRGCPKCNKHYIRSEEEIINELKKVNPNVKVIGKYENTQKGIEVECIICGHKWKPVVNSLLNQHTGCPECRKKVVSKKNMLSKEEIIHRMNRKHPEVEILGNIVDKDTPVKCKCKSCGNTWEAKYSSLRNSAGCPRCMHQELITNEEFYRRVHKYNPQIQINGNYNGQKSRVHCKCTVCGYEWDGISGNLMMGQGCKICAIERNSKAQRKSPEEYVREVKKKNKTITITSEYVNGSTKISYHCNICGYDGKCKPFALLQGQGCSNCNHRSVSFAECFIAASFSMVLGEGVVKRRNRSLISKELDILIPSLKIAIEPGSWYWHKNKIGFDKQKQQMCSEKGIRLIIIYTDYPEENAPIANDCWVYKDDFSRDKKHINLKKLVFRLFDEVGIEKKFDDSEWKLIENIAYIDSRRITTQELIKRVKPDQKGFTILDEYTSVSKPIKCKCLKCDHEWYPLASVLLYNDSGCPRCAGVVKKSQEEFEKEVEQKNPNIRIVGRYINRKTPIECECRKCGRHFNRVPTNILYGAGCPDCKKEEALFKIRKDPTKFEEEFKLKGDKNITIIGKYVRMQDHIECKCNKCGYMWPAPPRDLLKGHGCPKCKKSAKKSQEEFEFELAKENPSMETITKYEGMNKPIKARCRICGFIIDTTPSSLIHNHKKCDNYKNHNLYLGTP